MEGAARSAAASWPELELRATLKSTVRVRENHSQGCDAWSRHAPLMWAFQGLSCVGSEIRWVKCRKTCFTKTVPPSPDRWCFLLTWHIQHLLQHFDSNLHVTMWKVSCRNSFLLSVWSWEVNFLDAQLDWWVCCRFRMVQGNVVNIDYIKVARHPIWTKNGWTN